MHGALTYLFPNDGGTIKVEKIRYEHGRLLYRFAALFFIFFKLGNYARLATKAKVNLINTCIFASSFFVSQATCIMLGRRDSNFIHVLLAGSFKFLSILSGCRNVQYNFADECKPQYNLTVTMSLVLLKVTLQLATTAVNMPASCCRTAKVFHDSRIICKYYKCQTS